MMKFKRKKENIDPFLNKNIEGFLIIKLLGNGVEGSVYLGLSQNNELYALKIIDLLKICKNDDIENEITCLKTLYSKQHILYYIDDFKYQNYYVIVTEFLEGYISLYEFIENSNKNFFDKIKKQIIKTIKSIHNQGYIHGDIGAFNILIHPETLNIKLIDFGRCKFTKNKKLQERDLSRIQSLF